MKRILAVLTTAVLSFATALAAETQPAPLHGNCRIAPATTPGKVQLEIEHQPCSKPDHCRSSHSGIAIGRFRGLSLADFARQGAVLDAQIVAESGTLSCSGVIRDSVLSGDLTFRPGTDFVARMRDIGFSGELDSEKLEAFTLFAVTTSWIKSLQNAGVTGLNTDNMLALRIFDAEPAYVSELADLGYKPLGADQLTAFRVHHVNAEEIRELQALGYYPTAEQLLQARIFQITPDFIRRMRSRGLKDLSISKLVEIRIFHLED